MRITLHSISRYLRSKLNFLGDNKILAIANVTHKEVCPICGHRVSKIVNYNSPSFVSGPSKNLQHVQQPQKFVCQNCGHMFSTWLDADLVEVGKFYSGIYDSDQLYHENLRYKFELNLMEYTLMLLEKNDNVSLLDFGCGPNTTAAKIMKDRGFDAKCCDILDGYDYDGEFYFKYKINDPDLHDSFDSIISMDVIEHLGNTYDSWIDLNRMLKMGGVMAHSFPSRIFYNLKHEYCQNPFHNCLFTEKSLRIIAEKTGFKYLGKRPFKADVPFVFRFRKVKNM